MALMHKNHMFMELHNRGASCKLGTACFVSRCHGHSSVIHHASPIHEDHPESID